MLITLIIFIIIILSIIILILTSVTIYNLQHVHVFVSRDEWSSVGHADMRRFSITAIIVVVITVKLFFLKKKKIENLTGRNHVGIVSHRIPSKKPPVK